MTLRDAWLLLIGEVGVEDAVVIERTAFGT